MSIIQGVPGRGSRRWLRVYPIAVPRLIGMMKQYAIYRVTLRPDGLTGALDRALDRVFTVKGDAQEVAKNLNRRTGLLHLVLDWRPEEAPK